MKITLDLSKLVEEGKLTPAEAERLKTLAAHDTGSLGINILLGFGVVAVSAGIVALVPTPLVGAAVGVAMFALGLALTLTKAEQWSLLAQICVVIGALIAAAGGLALGEGSLASLIAVTAGLAAASVVARSNLLTAAAVLALAACLGARSGYWHATYSLTIYEPAVTVVLFSLVALVAYLISKQLAADYERLALTASRTSIFLVNFGFWIGSLWGDRLLLFRSLSGEAVKGAARSAYTVVIPDWVFGALWAVALIGVGVWGAMVNRRWVVNVAAVFAAIHFYTQWFERLGATPLAILLGGLILLGVAIGLWTFNRRARTAPA
jgi:iron complex transport system permease protein